MRHDRLPPELPPRAAANCNSMPAQTHKLRPMRSPDTRPAARRPVRGRAPENRRSRRRAPPHRPQSPSPRHMVQRQNVMMRPIKRRADQIVHRRIHHHKLLRRALLPIQHTRQQHPGGPTMERPGSTITVRPSLPMPRPAAAEMKSRIAGALSRRPDKRCRARRPDRHDRSRCPSACSALNQRQHLARGFQNRRIIQNLRTDMAIHAAGAQMCGTPSPGDKQRGPRRYRCRICDRAAPC